MKNIPKIALSKFASYAKIQEQAKTKYQNRKIPIWTETRLTLTHLMSQKRNIKGGTDLKYKFQNISQHFGPFIK